MKTTLTLTIIAALTASLAFADNHKPSAEEAAVKARKAQMTLYSYQLAVLGGMAKGEIDYDADAASKAAANLAALAKLDQSRLWPEGSDNFELGDATRTLPKLWEDGDKVMELSTQMAEAATALEAAAGTDLDSLRAALGPVGESCGACHKPYRAPIN